MIIAKLALAQRIIVTVVIMDIIGPMENAKLVTQIVIVALAQQQIAEAEKMDIILIQQVNLVFNV